MVRRRLIAGLIDVALVLAWAVVVIGVFFAADWLGWTRGLTTTVVQAIIGTSVGIPALAVFAVWEASPKQGTMGKRYFGLRVVGADGGRVNLIRALVRNLLKIGVPVLLLHLASLSLIAPGVDSWILTAIAVALPGCYLAALFIGSGRT
ncbi:MAG: RDD family protein, partial [Propionibacteriaceae bacterium]|nr:RDD family protein [Propionibacteriaceae bacterium]